jgi:diguanylate cyclase (GGDEF)-like protein
MASLVARAPEPIALLTNDGRVEFANAALEHLTATAPQGARFLELVPSKAHDRVRDALVRAGRYEDVRLSVRHRDGNGNYVGVDYRLFRLSNDIVAALGRIQAADRGVSAAEIAEESEPAVDPGTGFLTPAHLRARLADAMAEADPRHAPVSAILIELVGLDRTIRSEGQRVGDSLRKAVAQRLRTLVRTGDTVGWFDDTRFVIVAPHCNADGAQIVATRLAKDMVATRFSVAGKARHVPLRTGVAEYDGKHGPHDLLAAAKIDLDS